MLTTACDLADMARAAHWPIRPAAQLYHQAGSAFGFDRLRAAAGSLKAADGFERLAVRRLIEDLVVEQTALTRKLIDFSGDRDAVDSVAEAKSLVRGWTALHADVAETCEAVFRSVEAAPGRLVLRQADHRRRGAARTGRRGALRAAARPAAFFASPHSPVHARLPYRRGGDGRGDLRG